MKRRTRKGFTLVELMVVIVIIGILGTVVVTNFVGQDDEARVGVAKSSLKSIFDAVQTYKLRVDDYPETLEELITGPSDYEGNWRSILVGGESALKDPWGNPYEMSEDENGEIVIICYGKDGTEGTTQNEFDKDLTYPEQSDE